MTLREEMELNLYDLRLSKAEAHECMQYVIEAAKKDDIFLEHYGTGCWEEEIIKFTPSERLTAIYQKFVLEEAFKWLASRYNAQTATLQKFHQDLHSLNVTALNGQETTE